MQHLLLLLLLFIFIIPYKSGVLDMEYVNKKHIHTINKTHYN